MNPRIPPVRRPSPTLASVVDRFLVSLDVAVFNEAFAIQWLLEHHPNSVTSNNQVHRRLKLLVKSNRLCCLRKGTKSLSALYGILNTGNAMAAVDNRNTHDTKSLKRLGGRFYRIGEQEWCDTTVASWRKEGPDTWRRA